MNDSTASIEDPRFAGVREWFETLQHRITAGMEALEREFAGVGADRPPGRFVLEPWERTDASGAPGRMRLSRAAPSPSRPSSPPGWSQISSMARSNITL